MRHLLFLNIFFKYIRVFYQRLFLCFAFVLFLTTMLACAGSLRSVSDIGGAPVEFSQELAKAEVPIADTTVTLSESTATIGPMDTQLTGPLAGKQDGAKITEIEKPTAPKSSDKIPKTSVSDSKPEVDPSVSSSRQTWSPTSWPYGVGERMELAIRYGPIEGGVGVFEVLEPKVLDGETVLHYRGTVKSSKMLELFYKIDDQIDSWVGIDDHLPRRQEIRQNETAFWGRRVVLFDHKENIAKFYSHTTRKSGEVIEIKREDAITEAAQDVFGALFYYRFASDLHGANFPIHDRWKNWLNELEFIGREKIRVPMGEMYALRFKMRPRVSGQLQPTGDVEIWVSEDDRKLLLRFRAHIKVGSLTGEIRSYHPGQKIAIPPPEMKTPLKPKQVSAN